MTTTLSRTQQNDIINLANSAIRSKVAKSYKGLFSTMDVEDMVGDTIYKACRVRKVLRKSYSKRIAA